jgi:hypothetical protein
MNGKLREGGEDTTSTLGDYSRQSSLLIVFLVVKAILGAIQTNLSGAASNFQGIMLGYSHPRNIRGPDRDDRHSFSIERMDAR